MSNTPISDLPVIVGLLPSAEIPAVQGGVTGRTTVAAIAEEIEGAVVGASYVLLSAEPLLASSRVLTASSNVTLTDAGAGSTVTVNLSTTGVSAGAYTSANVTVDLYGRITAISSSGAGTVTSVSGGTGITISGTAADPVVNIATTGVTAATYGSATKAPQIALNAQGQATTATEVTITPAVGSVTGLGTGVATALGVNVGSAGAVVVNGGALGTPSSGTLTSVTGLPIDGGTTGTLPVGRGGTGATSLTDHGVLVGSAAAAIDALAVGDTGTLLAGVAGADPAFTATPTVGIAGTTTGTLGFTGKTSGTVTVAAQAAAGTYNFNLPVAAGSSSDVLTSAGGGASAMTWTAVASAATASTLALRDSSANIIFNNVRTGYTTTATAAGTTTLTVASTQDQFFTGATTQTVVLPVTSTLSLGFTFRIVNNSTGAVTVQSSGANSIIVLPGSSMAILTCILTSGTTAASWSAQYFGYKTPTVQTFTSGSGTYTTPAGTRWIRIRLVGGGGGGAGSGTTPGNGGNAGDTTFSTLTGGGGQGAATTTGGVAGSASGGNILNINGSVGSDASAGYDFQIGGLGGGTVFGSPVVSPASYAGQSPPTNTGVGGSGGSADATASPGGGGGGGGYVEHIIGSPATSYSYAVGAGGAAGTIGGGTNPRAGIAGAAGYIVVEEYYA